MEMLWKLVLMVLSGSLHDIQKCMQQMSIDILSVCTYACNHKYILMIFLNIKWLFS